MRRRRLLAAGVAAVLVVAALLIALLSGGGGSRAPGPTASSPASTASAPPPPESARGTVGINVNYLFNTDTYSAAQVAAQLTEIRATGATLARSDALWEAAEPAAPSGGVHHWHWAFDDRIALALASHGLRWLPILDYTAAWAQSIPGQDHSPPVSDGAFAAFAAAFAARYGPGGGFWKAHRSLATQAPPVFEVWNEPDNTPFWLPKPDPAAYAQLYLAARAAVHAVDPSVRVIVGGLAHPTTFLPALVQAVPQLRGAVDGVAIHPYAPDPAAVVRFVAAARATLDALGMKDVPLYATEFGWTTNPPHALNWAPEQVRPSLIETTLGMLGHLGCGLAASYLYTWVTPESDPADREDWYGIASPDGGPTADTRAFAAGVRAAEGPGPQVPCPAAG